MNSSMYLYTPPHTNEMTILVTWRCTFPLFHLKQVQPTLKIIHLINKRSFNIDVTLAKPEKSQNILEVN